MRGNETRFFFAFNSEEQVVMRGDFARVFMAGAMGLSVLMSGCASRSDRDVRPTSDRYTFLSSTADLKEKMPELYPKDRKKDLKPFAAHVGGPENYRVCVNDNDKSWALPTVGEQGGKIDLRFASGVYPFQLFGAQKDSKGKSVSDCSKLNNPEFSGAFAFYNNDKDMEIVTFGRAEDTFLVSSKVLDKVRDGLLGSHTISFDGKPRITYWVGNRRELDKGGDPTVELDFGKANLASLKLDDKKVDGATTAVAVFAPPSGPTGSGRVRLEHRLYMRTANGTEYEGYIRDLKDNEFTAFMRVPCDIPQDLFDAAARGTVSKYDVNYKNENGDEVKIAQIVFGLKR